MRKEAEAERRGCGAKSFPSRNWLPGFFVAKIASRAPSGIV